MIKGMPADRAVHQLKFAQGKAPEILLHVLTSAVANAVNTHELEKDSIKVASVVINQGLVMKRFMPVSKGMAHSILKRSAHVTVVVEGVEKAASDKKTKKAEIKTITASEFVASEQKLKQEEQEVAHEELHKHDTPETRAAEVVQDKTRKASGKIVMNQQGSDKKTHRRKSIG